jgi:hypothetical protein
VSRQVPANNDYVLFDVYLFNPGPGTRASDVPATRVLSIRAPSSDVLSTRDGANVHVHDTIPVNDDDKR